MMFLPEFNASHANLLTHLKYSKAANSLEILAKTHSFRWSNHCCSSSASSLADGQSIPTHHEHWQHDFRWTPSYQQFGRLGHDGHRGGFAGRLYAFLAGSTARNIFRRRAFFIERKEKHGLELVFAFEKWLEDEIKFSDNYDSVDLAVMHVSTTLGAKPAHYTTLSGEVIAKERTYGDYAFQHIMTGYPEIFNSWHVLANSANIYAGWAKSTFPRIKQDLETAIRRFLPNLHLGPLDTEDYCDLDALLTKFIECKLRYDTLDFLRHDSLPAERTSSRHALYVTTHENKKRLLLRTHVWMDSRMFTEVVPTIFVDKTIQEELDTISSRLSSIRSNSESFKVGPRDLVNGLKLGGRLIEGDCANCKDLETRLLLS